MGGHKAKAERERGKERESQSVSDQMTLMALDCGAGQGWGVCGGRWEQRQWREVESADRKRWEEG